MELKIGRQDNKSVKAKAITNLRNDRGDITAPSEPLKWSLRNTTNSCTLVYTPAQVMDQFFPNHKLSKPSQNETDNRNGSTNSKEME